MSRYHKPWCIGSIDSEETVVAMALYWEAWDGSEIGSVTPQQAIESWPDVVSRPLYCKRARAFLRALRSGR